jgi:hypothetical protein
VCGLSSFYGCLSVFIGREKRARIARAGGGGMLDWRGVHWTGQAGEVGGYREFDDLFIFEKN